MKSILLPLLILSGCAASSLKVSSTPVAVDPASWTSVKLVDLTDQPVVTSGESIDRTETYVSITLRNVTKYYQIDHTSPQLHEVPAFEIPTTATAEMQTYARDVQNYGLYEQYQSAWRCRYSSAWSSIASRDLRREGPLLLNVQQLNSDAALGFRILVAIDSTSFDVVGLSGITIPQVSYENRPYYASSIDGENRVFGIVSSSTMINAEYMGSCTEAYLSTLEGVTPAPWSRTARSMDPRKEKTVSKYLDVQAGIESVDLRKQSNQIYIAKPFGVAEQKDLTPLFNLEEINNLIKTASSGTGVGL